jgi:5-methylcytosine-specific restriction endonuclease McrA
MKIIHHLFYLIEQYRTPSCFDIPSEKRKSLKLSEKRELAAKFNYQCDCCGDRIGDITRGTNEDHIRELQYFGTNDIDNFQLLCLNCHNYKTKLNVKKKRKLEEVMPAQSKRRKINIASAP